MQDYKRDYYLPGEVRQKIRDFKKYLRSKWVPLLLTALAGAVLGAGAYFIQKPRYEAEVTFILEEKSSSGGLAGLASQFGLNLGGLGASGGIFSGDNILEILKSKKVIQHVLLTKVDTSPDAKTLADLYVAQYGPKGTGFSGQQISGSNIQDSVLNLAFDRIIKKQLITERVRKQGSIIKVKLTVSDMILARLMSERMVAEAGKLYMDTRTGLAQENIRQLQSRSDSLLRLLNYKSFGAASVQPLDVNPGLKEASVPSEIATRDKTVIATLYIEVMKNLEASKLMLSQESPVIQMLDSPGVHMEDRRKSLPFLTIALALTAGFIGLGIYITLYLLMTSEKNKSYQ